jgi:hypothetical protein
MLALFPLGRLGFLLRENSEVLRLYALVGERESLGGQSTFEYFANGAARLGMRRTKRQSSSAANSSSVSMICKRATRPGAMANPRNY